MHGPNKSVDTQLTKYDQRLEDALRVHHPFNRLHLIKDKPSFVEELHPC